MSLRSRIVLISSLAVTGVTAAGETIQRVVGEIERVSRIVAEIEVSMEEQSVGITQIDRSVAEMDRATQQNAALVEQAAAAALSFEDQSRQLQAAVAAFDVGETSRGSAVQH